jgi:hypothetical protein
MCDILAKGSDVEIYAIFTVSDGNSVIIECSAAHVNGTIIVDFRSNVIEPFDINAASITCYQIIIDREPSHEE